jgi:2-polyprenyl-6-methoxyphenol hydroxylase-like FAD-dependent oxidoreductase
VRSTFDVAIVGGGPAGLATAIACRARGLATVVVERAPRLPIDKACGEGLMPGALAALAELGVELPAGLGRSFRGIRYRDGEVTVEAPFHGGRRGLGLRRTALHAALLERARALGVEHRPPGPILLGRHLLALGLKPGPRIGEILKAVYEQQLDGAVATLDEAIAAAKLLM